MEITYSLTKDDLFRYSSFLVRRTPSLRIRLVVMCLLVPLIYLVISMAELAPSQDPRAVWIVTTAIAVFWIPILLWLNRWSVIRSAKTTPGMFEPHTVKINKKGFHSTSSHTETNRAWQSFIEISDNAHAIFLLMNPTYGIMIPKSAFLSPEDAEAFLQTAKAFWKSAVFGGDVPTVPESTAWPPSPRRGK